MSKTVKAWLIAAAALVIVGSLLFFGVMMAYRWDFTRLNTVRHETKTYEISEAFSGVTVRAQTADILFSPSVDGACRVICSDRETVAYSVGVEDGTLTVSAEDGGKWIDRVGIDFCPSEITVYLPEAQYGSLVAQTTTGDIVVGDLTAETLELSVSTGSVTVSDVSCKNLLSTGSTGDVTLKNVIAAEKLSLERKTGDIRFDGSDAAEVLVKTTTGDVAGDLLSAKVFVTETSTGSVRVPQTTAGGTCRITTTTGDIEIEAP